MDTRHTFPLNFSPWLTNVKIQELCQGNLYPSKTVGNKDPQSQGNVETRLHGRYLGQHQHRVEDVPSEPSRHVDCSLPLEWFPVQKEPPEGVQNRSRRKVRKCCADSAPILTLSLASTCKSIERVIVKNPRGNQNKWWVC